MTDMGGLVVIGYFVWWSIQNVDLTRTAFKEMLDASGLNHSFTDDLTEAVRRSLFLKAVRDVKAGNKKYLIRKIQKASNKYVFGLVDETIDKKHASLEYAHSATMIFYPAIGSISCNAPHRVFDEVSAAYKQYQEKVDSASVRETILEIINGLPTVSVRQRGGIYFLPKDYEEIVVRLEKLVEQVGGDSHFAVAPQIDTERSKTAIYKAFVAGLKAKIDGFKEELEDDTLKRPSAFKNRLEMFKELRKEIEFYRDRLSFQAEHLDEQLVDLTTKIKKKLSD